MWILPSRSRPHNFIRFVKAYRATGASTQVWVRLDSDDPMISAYDIPDNWLVVVGPRQPLSDVYNEFLGYFPNAPWFGFIADDVVPRTPQWDEKLITIAGASAMAVPAGGHDPEGAPHFVLGGDLVREIGWLSLPGLNRLYIDTVWQDIATSRGVLRRAPEVVLEHHHFSNGKSLFDTVYRKMHKQQDRAIYERWRQTPPNT